MHRQCAGHRSLFYPTSLDDNLAQRGTVASLQSQRFLELCVRHSNTLAAQHRAVEPYVGWFGQRWFLLPNPTYGNWYSAPYGDDDKLPFERKRQLKQQALQLQQ